MAARGRPGIRRYGHLIDVSDILNIGTLSGSPYLHSIPNNNTGDKRIRPPESLVASLLEAKDGKTMRPTVSPAVSQPVASVDPLMGGANPIMGPSHGQTHGHPDGSYIERPIQLYQHVVAHGDMGVPIGAGAYGLTFLQVVSTPLPMFN